MTKETITFEVVLHFEGSNGYDESINFLKKEVTRALIKEITDLQDIEVNFKEHDYV